MICGILHVLKVGYRWCDCPADYGPSTTIYNRFNRWSRRGFWLKLLDALVEAGAVTKITAIDSTYIKAQRAAFGAKGRAAQAIGRSRGGWTTKVHALTDVIGRPYALILTPGNTSDMKAAPALLEQAGPMRYLLGDKGYDADRLRRLACEAGAIPVMLGRRNRRRTIRYGEQRYRSRHLIENAFCRLKDFRRVSDLFIQKLTVGIRPNKCQRDRNFAGHLGKRCTVRAFLEGTDGMRPRAAGALPISEDFR